MVLENIQRKLDRTTSCVEGELYSTATGGIWTHNLPSAVGCTTNCTTIVSVSYHPPVGACVRLSFVGWISIFHSVCRIPCSTFQTAYQPCFIFYAIASRRPHLTNLRSISPTMNFRQSIHHNQITAQGHPFSDRAITFNRPPFYFPSINWIEIERKRSIHNRQKRRSKNQLSLSIKKKYHRLISGQKANQPYFLPGNFPLLRDWDEISSSSSSSTTSEPTEQKTVVANYRMRGSMHNPANEIFHPFFPQEHCHYLLYCHAIPGSRHPAPRVLAAYIYQSTDQPTNQPTDCGRGLTRLMKTGHEKHTVAVSVPGHTARSEL